MKYNFPETVFVNQLGNRDQLDRIKSEMDEVLKEVECHNSPLHPDLIDEITDLYHSIETFIRMNKKAFEESFNRVFEKNRARGYYWRKNRKDPENRTDDDDDDDDVKLNSEPINSYSDPYKMAEGMLPSFKEYIEEAARVNKEALKTEQLRPGRVTPLISITPSPVVEGYVPLYSVLMDALEQAQRGKGSERHGQGLPFEEQTIIVVPKLQESDKGLVYQAIKKMLESQRMETEPAIRERLGAINYIAASILFLKGKGK